MKVEIRLFASLQKYAGQQEELELRKGATVGDCLESAGIPSTEVAIVLVNGRHAKNDQILNDGESISLFPPIAGG